jgi:hypothetical protein
MPRSNDDGQFLAILKPINPDEDQFRASSVV